MRQATRAHTHNGNLRPKTPTKNNNLEEKPEDVGHTNPINHAPHPILKTIDNATYYHCPKLTPYPLIPTQKPHISPVINH